MNTKNKINPVALAMLFLIGVAIAFLSLFWRQIIYLWASLFDHEQDAAFVLLALFILFVLLVVRIARASTDPNDRPTDY